MAAIWIGYFFDQTDLKDSLLLLALAIADHADPKGIAYPGISRLAQKIRKSERHTKLLAKQLEAMGYVEVTRGVGRTHRSQYQIKKPKPMTRGQRENESIEILGSFAVNNGVVDNTVSETKRCYPESKKGVIQGREKVSPSVFALKEEPLLEPKIEPRATKDAESPLDQPEFHPAIVAIREVAGRYPPKPSWVLLIEAIGDDPDTQLLRKCFGSWSANGYNPTNYAWALEWYRYGIPTYRQNRNGNCYQKEPSYFKGPSEETADAKQCSFAEEPTPVPAENVPSEQQHVWQLFLDKIRAKVNIEVYNTWFMRLIFDGFNTENNAFEVRTGQTTRNWVGRYYTDLVEEALSELGLDQFTIRWTIDDG